MQKANLIFQLSFDTCSCIIERIQHHIFRTTKMPDLSEAGQVIVTLIGDQRHYILLVNSRLMPMHKIHCIPTLYLTRCLLAL